MKATDLNHARSNEPTKVFISYSRDSEKRKREVRELAQALREDGVNCTIDQFCQSPSNWELWMIEQIKTSDYVLLICSESYSRLFAGEDGNGRGLGVSYESTLIREQLYESRQARFYPVFFEAPKRQLIPTGVRTTFFDLSTYDLETLSSDTTRLDHPGGYEKLYRLLTGQPDVTPQAIGTLKQLSTSTNCKTTSPQLHSNHKIRASSQDSFTRESTNKGHETPQTIIIDKRKIGNLFGDGTTVNGNISASVNSNTPQDS